jgi:glycosyltransferase involved in cell wall biosynthesis
MKILQLVTKRQFRGAEVFAANLSEELLNLGHEIIFAGLYKNYAEILKVNHATNIDLIENEKSFSPLLIKKLVNLIKKEKPDIIQCNGSDTLKYAVGASFFTPHIPILYRNISIISEWVPGGPKRILYKNLFKGIAHVSSVGEEAAADFIRTFNYPSSRVSVTRRGIPIKKIGRDKAEKNLRNELNLREEDTIAMHIGNFSIEKNHTFLFDVFEDLKEQYASIKLVCVGTGVLFEELKADVVNRKLCDTIYFLGFRKDIPELLAGADIFVLSSKVEGVPGVILEAAAQRVPSIATDVGGVREVLSNNHTGYIIQNFDEEEFRKKIIQLAVDDMLRYRLGANAYELVVKNFNPVKNAQKFETLYLEMSGVNQSGLRILQLIQKKQYRGAEVFASQISNHIIDKGHQVKIYSIYEGTADLPFKGQVFSLDRNISNRYFDFTGWQKLSDIIKSFRPDIVQANAADTLKYAIFSKLFFRWNIPVVFRNASASSFYIKNRFSRKMNSFLLKRTDCIISVSQSSKKDINNLFPFTKEKSIVIPVGIELEEKSSLEEIKGPFNDQKKNILHIGSFTHEKNHQELIRIFRKVHKKLPEAVLHLVGDGPLKSEVECAIQAFNLNDCVVLHGELNCPYPYLKKADVLVLPSLIEGLPAVLLEAMLLKTITVSYNVGGVKEVISQDTGYLVEEGDTVKGFLSESDIEGIIKKMLLVTGADPKTTEYPVDTKDTQGTRMDDSYYYFKKESD